MLCGRGERRVSALVTDVSVLADNLAEDGYDVSKINPDMSTMRS